MMTGNGGGHHGGEGGGGGGEKKEGGRGRGPPYGSSMVGVGRTLREVVRVWINPRGEKWGKRNKHAGRSGGCDGMNGGGISADRLSRPGSTVRFL